MAAGSYGGILPDCNTDLDAGDNLQECHRGLPEVYADSWLDVMDHRNRDSHFAGASLQDPYLCGEEVKKDWLFEVILVALILPFFWFWAGVPSMHLSRYVRGLLSLPSHILHISDYISINY
jgi:hypothetical protein